jgi:hypothetical protein
MSAIIAAAVFASLALYPGADTALFTDWSAPVNLGPVVNTPYVDSCVAISKNGLSLFFSSTRQSPGTTNRDLYVTQRASTDAAWGIPVPVTALNTTAWESCPALSLDEHRLYFTSPRTGGCGTQDIWVARRQDRRNDLGWGEPENLGCESDGYFNTPYSELTPAFFEDERGRVLMYFSSNRPGSRAWDFYQSEMRPDDTFGPATPVAELNSEFVEQGVVVRRDGLEAIFLSNRGTHPDSLDFFKATRASTADPWSDIVPLPSLGDPAYGQGRISLSFDGRELYFTSWLTDSGTHPDLFVARREKVKGRK